MTIFCGSDIETMIPEEPPDSDDGHRTEDPPRDIDPTWLDHREDFFEVSMVQTQRDVLKI